MRCIERVLLTELMPVKNWFGAAQGTFLQVQREEDETPWIGFKTSNLADDNGRHMLLYIESCGFVPLGTWPALDVSQLIEFAVDNPALMSVSEPTPGRAYLATDGAIFVWTRTGSDAQAVCIQPSETFKLGECINNFDWPNAKEIGALRLLKKCPLEKEKNN